MTLYEHVLQCVQNFPFETATNEYDYVTYFSLIENRQLMCKDFFMFAINYDDIEKCTFNKDLDNKICNATYFSFSDFKERSQYHHKIILNEKEYLLITNDTFRHCDTSIISHVKQYHKVPTTKDEWFNLSVLIPTLITLEDFSTIKKIIAAAPLGCEFEFYTYSWNR